MMELGKKSHIYHKKVTNFINKSDIDKTYVYGKRASKAYKFIKKIKEVNLLIILRNSILKFQKF